MTEGYDKKGAGKGLASKCSRFFLSFERLQVELSEAGPGSVLIDPGVGDACD